MAERLMLPVVDRDSQTYFDGLADGRLLVQRCRDCGRWTWPARPLCSGCHNDNLAWEPAVGTGTVYSWVVTHQIYSPDFAALVPYTVVLVRLDEQDDILIPGRLCSDVEVHQGLRVRMVPERLADGLSQISWETDGGAL